MTDRELLELLEDERSVLKAWFDTRSVVPHVAKTVSLVESVAD